MSALGIERPVIQAPMASTATPELAAAVSGAGVIFGAVLLAVGLWLHAA